MFFEFTTTGYKTTQDFIERLNKTISVIQEDKISTHFFTAKISHQLSSVALFHPDTSFSHYSQHHIITFFVHSYKT